ncbi:hypothetical protein GIB67_014236 [Kingdonia uniflora]|uniref:Uncharacterized protein n=1 Tax=Kingdonia uniflora TaxID=39325 RepID=A0A7J7M1W3_9MAGN|nr:hypothetical protein GIB67_014236 [Kingdonia uniflora]
MTFIMIKTKRSTTARYRHYLVDEDMEELTVQFLHEHRRLKGWEVFSTAHKLVEGDALVFQLVNSTEFQVMNLLMIISVLS